LNSEQPRAGDCRKKVRRAVGLNVLRKIGVIVAEEQQADADKARVLRWFARYGWIVMTGSALLLAYLTGVI
jgi:hypothetical protein